MTARGSESALERARDCFSRCDWMDAYEAFSWAEREAPLDGPDLERWAYAAALSGHDDEFVKLLERFHQAQLDQGASLPAARTAFWLGNRLMFRGDAGRGGAWLARAQRIVDQVGTPCAEQGFLLLPMAHRHLGAGDYEAALTAASRAAEIGERFSEPELIAIAGHLQGRALLQLGRIDEGLTRLDETMLAASSGKLMPLVTGLLYCGVMGAFNLVYAYDRAREWTSTLAAYAASQPQLVTFASACLVHRAELMQFGGDWVEAIAEAERAAVRGMTSVDGGRGAALYQRAEILRMRGEFAEAEAAYREANQVGCDPQPGLALLRLAQGRSDAAASAVKRALSASSTPLARTRFLPACVEILIEAGDLEGARSACDELERVAATHGTEVLGAMAAHARGALRLREGDARGALEPLRRALSGWQRVGAPYLTARLRVAIAKACHALGDCDSAELELDAAREVFERLGAAPDLATCNTPPAAAEGAGAAPTPVPAHGLSGRELQVLRLVAAGKTNRAIARELHLSEKTVDRHVSNIFTKLDVGSRAAATAFAYEHKLI